MSERQEAILALLERCHRGRQNPIRGWQIGRMFGVGEREVQEDIMALRLSGVPVCSAVRAPHGYYLPVNKAELDEYERSTRAKAVNILRSLAAVMKSREQFEQTVQQLVLEIGGEVA